MNYTANFEISYFSHYQQRVEVSVFPSQVTQFYFEKEYKYVDQFGDTVTCYGVDHGDHIESITTGGRGKIGVPRTISN